MFESLLRDGKIRLRSRVKELPLIAIQRILGRICREHQFVACRKIPSLPGQNEHELEFTFCGKPTPPSGTTAEEVWGTADFDAMLKALEPYEVIEPAIREGEGQEHEANCPRRQPIEFRKWL